jgi:hypothetical protein
MTKASVSRFLMVVVFFLMGVLVTAFLVIKPSLFMTNPYFNGSIASIWLFGVGIVCASLVSLYREEGLFHQKSPRVLKILRPLVSLYERCPQANEAMIEKALAQCYHGWNQDFLRYLAGSLIFLGLLGTLWGLSETIVAISDVIGHLPAQDAAEGFLETLKTQLQLPLAGMGVAFSSSLLGVAGTLTMGFLIVQLDRAKDCFFQKAEWWAGSIFPSAAETSRGVEGHFDVSLARWADGIERLGRLHINAEKRQTEWLDAVIRLGGYNQSALDWMKGQSMITQRLAEENTLIRQTLERLAQSMHDMGKNNQEIQAHLGKTSLVTQEILRHMADQSWIDVVRTELSAQRRFQSGEERRAYSEGKKP